MSRVMVHRAESGKAAVVNPFFDKVEHALEAVRRRAYELFEARGRAPGGELDDWLRAERELFLIPEAEVSEDDKSFTMKIAAPGFGAKDIDVIALPRELLVEAKEEKQSGSAREAKCLYRRFELAAPVETEAVKASIENGNLTIRAPKQAIPAIPARAVAA